jgi:hypothetical protein
MVVVGVAMRVVKVGVLLVVIGRITVMEVVERTATIMELCYFTTTEVGIFGVSYTIGVSYTTIGVEVSYIE